MPVFGENNQGRRKTELAVGGSFVIAIGTAALVARLRHGHRVAERQSSEYIEHLRQFSDERIDGRVRNIMSIVAAHVYVKTIGNDNALLRQTIEERVVSSLGTTPQADIFNESLNRLTDSGLLVIKGIPEGAGRRDAPKGFAAGTIHFDPSKESSIERELAPEFCGEVLKLLEVENAFAETLERGFNGTGQSF